jgi:DNA invertase Pin-like site-specific DNA recombinase
MNQPRSIPAAQYVRMSTEEQCYSIRNQKAAIAEYAGLNGFEIIRTYEDPGESGLSLHHRVGLRELLTDVVSRHVAYKKILVLDVSRWGRFQDPDEAAHYEFICKKRGIGVIYCGETFQDRNTIADYFAKVLRRTSAAEYSYELSIKAFENAKRVMELGFWIGGPAPFGYRRLLVNSEGQSKGILEISESKMLTSDRVKLVHGPDQEVNCVRSIFSMCCSGKSATEIAQQLNRKGVLRVGKRWNAPMIHRILANRQYTGTYIWNKSTKRLGSREKRNPPEAWLVKVDAFPIIVTQKVFACARVRLRKRILWQDCELIEKVKVLFKRKGYLSQRLIRRAKNMPGIATLHRRIGTLEKIYALVGYKAPSSAFSAIAKRYGSQKLREGLVRQLLALFPDRIHSFRIPRKHRVMLEVEGTPVSILVCRNLTNRGKPGFWSLDPASRESENVTLLCRLNSSNNGFDGFRLLPRLGHLKSSTFSKSHRLLSQGVALSGLEDLCNAVGRLKLKDVAGRQKLQAIGHQF